MWRSRTPLAREANLALGALLLGVFCICLTASTDGDVFWHLAAGREIIERGKLLSVDPFSLSARGKPWVDVHWLFQVICACTYRLGGLRALVVGKAFVVSVGALLLAGVVRLRAGARALPFFTLCFLAALLAVRDLLLLRPTIFTLSFVAAFVYIIEHARREERPHELWLLPLLQIVWVNVQGLFALGPGIVFAYWLGATWDARAPGTLGFPFEGLTDDRSRSMRSGLLLAAASSLAACVVSPFGLRAFALPTKLLGRLTPDHANAFSLNITENVPPFTLEQQTGQFWHLKWFLLALLLVVVIAGRRLRACDCLLVGGFLALALIANRNVLLFYWVTTPIAVAYFFPRMVRLMPRLRAAHTWSRRATGLGVLAILCVAANARAHETPLDAPAPFRVPELSARWIAEHGGTSRIFAADHYGGYLIWKLFPHHVPYIDTRLILRSEQQFAEYLAVVDEPERFDAFAERFQFDYVVLPTSYPDRYLALLRHLNDSSRWRLVLSDGSETLFARPERSAGARLDLGAATTTDSLLADFEHRYADPRVRADARLQLATLQLALGHAEAADHTLESLEDVQARALRARAYLARGDSASAGLYALRALSADPNHVRSLNLLAVLSLQRGELGKAVGYLRRAVRANPFDPETRTILRSLEEKPHDAIN